MNQASKILQQRLDDNPRLPPATRHVMKKLATVTAEPAWRVLGDDDATVGRVVNRVRTAFEAALKEVSRPNIKDEREDIARILKLSADLKMAIKTSSLPGDWVRCDRHELKAEDMPDVPIDLGWHSLRPEGYAFGYPLAVVDVLDWAIDMAAQHAENLPVRALQRKGDTPEVSSFVRRLAWQFLHEFGSTKQSTIGHITSAIFDLSEPMDKTAVQGILKDSPAPFKHT